MLTVPLLALTLLTAPGAASVPAVAHPEVAVQALPSVVNPKAATRSRTVTITVIAEAAGTVVVEVVDARGLLVADLTGPRSVNAGGEVQATWSPGKAADGAYGVRARLTGADGTTREAVTPVEVDASAPRVTIAAPAPAVTDDGPVTLRVAAEDTSGVDERGVRVLRQTGEVIGTIPLPDDADAVEWDLRLRGRLLLPGVYRLEGTAVDAVGNAGTSTTARLLRVDRAVGSQQVYSLRDAGNVVALTYDDCGDSLPWERILRAFRVLGAKASFFCNGLNVRRNAAVARRTVAEGHTIGSHTWAHPWMTKLAAGERARQLAGDKEIWWEVARVSPSPFFRPPYGDVDAAVRSSAGRAGFAWTVLWDVDPSDYLSPPPATLIEHVRANARAGSIIVLHTRLSTAEATPGMIKALRAKGLEPVSLDEMFGRASYLSRGRG